MKKLNKQIFIVIFLLSYSYAGDKLNIAVSYFQYLGEPIHDCKRIMDCFSDVIAYDKRNNDNNRSTLDSIFISDLKDYFNPISGDELKSIVDINEKDIKENIKILNKKDIQWLIFPRLIKSNKNGLLELFVIYG